MRVDTYAVTDPHGQAWDCARIATPDGGAIVHVQEPGDGGLFATFTLSGFELRWMRYSLANRAGARKRATPTLREGADRPEGA